MTLPDTVDQGAGQTYSDHLKELMAELRKLETEDGDRVFVTLSAEIYIARGEGNIPVGTITNGFGYGRGGVETEDAQAGPSAPPRPADVVQPVEDVHLGAALDDGHVEDAQRALTPEGAPDT